MPAKMKNYEYPRVHPPISKIQPQDEYLRASVPDSRFSWVQTPAEATGRMWQQNNPDKHSEVPPLPQIPNHLNPAKEVVDNEHIGDSLEQTPQNHAYPQQQPHPNVPVYSTYTSQTNPKPPEHDSHVQHTYQSVPLEQKSQKYAEPVKQPYKFITETSMPVVPDANPLSPTSPTKSEHEVKTTNMAIIPPSDSSQFTVGSYTPTPQPLRGGIWQHSFCSCAEPSTCMTALFCPCIIYGKTQYRLGLKSEKKDPTNMLGYSAINGSCMAFGLLCGINSILATIQHTRIRKSYAMDGAAGNVAGDCIKSLCCCCCVVAQDEKEMKFRKRKLEEQAEVGEARKKLMSLPLE